MAAYQAGRHRRSSHLHDHRVSAIIPTVADVELHDEIVEWMDSLDDDESPDAEDDADWFAAKRLLFADVAALALAGIRAIDRR